MNTSPWWPLCVVLFAMFIGVEIAKIPKLPRCPFCGKNGEHAKDCPTQKGL